jgi:hypothetical protein
MLFVYIIGLMRLEVLMEPTCSTIEYEERALPPGRSYLEPVQHLFALPSADLQSYLSDTLADPDAEAIRTKVGVPVEVAESSAPLVVDRAAVKRKAAERAQSKRASKRRKFFYPLPLYISFVIPNEYSCNNCVL